MSSFEILDSSRLSLFVLDGFYVVCGALDPTAEPPEACLGR